MTRTRGLYRIRIPNGDGSHTYLTRMVEGTPHLCGDKSKALKIGLDGAKENAHR